MLMLPLTPSFHSLDSFLSPAKDCISPGCLAMFCYRNFFEMIPSQQKTMTTTVTAAVLSILVIVVVVVVVGVTEQNLMISLWIRGP